MKTLILMRHGKSSWDYSVEDRDRPLKERGIADAYRVATAFADLNIKVDAAYSSPANRALHTCIIALETLHFPLEKLGINKQLYDFSGSGVLDFVRTLDDKNETVLIFGHNNAFTNFVNSLGSLPVDNVPTSGLVQLDFSVERWEDIKKGVTQRTLFPKQLKK
ncbi:MAG: histidine phosphatase family protein [Sediminicola sp.]